MIDIVDIKQAVKNGELYFYVREAFDDKGFVDHIYCKNDVGECVKVGEVEMTTRYEGDGHDK